MRARGTFFSKKHVTPVYSETTTLSKPYFILKRRSMRKFLRNRLLFKKQKVWFDRLLWHWRPFSRLNFKTSLFYGGIRSADCWLSRAIGSQNAVVFMLRKLLLLEGSWGKYAIPYILLAKYAKLTLAFFFCSWELVNNDW